MSTYSAIVRLRREGLGSARTHTVTVVLDAVSPDEAIVHAEALALATIKEQPLLWRVEESWLTDELVDTRAQRDVEKYLNERVCCDGANCSCGGITRLQQLVQEEAGGQLARVTAERDTSKRREDEMRGKLLKEIESACALRARVADCEELLTHREHDIERYKQRNTELVAALEVAKLSIEQAVRAGGEDFIGHVVILDRIRITLARHRAKQEDAR